MRRGGGLQKAAARGLDVHVQRIRCLARDLKALSQRTDYELRDMGISRSDIPAIMAGTYRRFVSGAASPRLRRIALTALGRGNLR